MALENIYNYIENAGKLNFSKVRLRICKESCKVGNLSSYSLAYCLHF